MTVTIQEKLERTHCSKTGTSDATVVCGTFDGPKNRVS